MRGITALTAAVTVWAGGAAAQEMRTFRDWQASCGNDGVCVAFGRPAADAPAWVRVEMTAGAQAEPRIRFGYLDYGAGDYARRYALAIDGADLRTTTNIDDLPALIGPAARAALDRMARGTSLSFRGGPEPAEVSLSGVSAALLWIDERQGRLDTPTALIRRGDRPAESVPPPPTLPRLRAAPATSQRAVEGRRVPASLPDLTDNPDCAVGDSPEWRPTAWRLGGDLLLWTLPCYRAAYNGGALLWTTREDGSGARQVALPSADGASTEFLVNGDYDPRTREMSGFSKGRGLGDCGVAQRWLWTGARFELLEERRMDDCFGVTAEHWPRLWRAQRID